MKRKYFAWIAFTEIVGIIAGILTREDTKIYAETITKPVFSPPALIFPIAWTILYALMGISAARVYASPKSSDRTKGLCMFMIQLAINFAWCFVFFMFRKYLTAFAVLIALLISIVMMSIYFRRIDRLSAYLQIPYILWLIFAGYLNLAVWYLNG